MFREREYLEEALAEWIETVVADNGRKDKVVYANKNGVRPVPPFIALQFTGGKRPGSPYRSKVNPATEEQELFAHSEKTVTLHGIGEGSFDLLQVIHDSIFIGKYKRFLRRKHLVVRKLTDVVEIGGEVDTEMESRARFDIRVSFIRVITNKPGWIERVEVKPENMVLEPFTIDGGENG